MPRSLANEYAALARVTSVDSRQAVQLPPVISITIMSLATLTFSGRISISVVEATIARLFESAGQVKFDDGKFVVPEEFLLPVRELHPNQVDTNRQHSTGTIMGSAAPETSCGIASDDII